MIPYTLNGSFDLHITDYCNLHCKGCVVLDYNQSGEVTNEKYTLDNVIDVISNLKKFNLKLEELKILGGEPTLHTDLNQIIDWVDQLSEVNTETVSPTFSSFDNDKGMKKREDKINDGNYREDITVNAPNSEEGFFLVPKVID